MKKNTRRLMALCLALGLMLSMVVMVSAATTASLPFSDETGAYTITMTKGAATTKVINVPDSPRYQHTYGTLTLIQPPQGLSVSHTVWLDDRYDVPLGTLLGRVGLRKSHVVDVSSEYTTFRLEPSDVTGTYILKATFYCNNASWTLVLDEPYSGSANTGESGTISSAPNGVCSVKLVKVS